MKTIKIFTVCAFLMCILNACSASVHARVGDNGQAPKSNTASTQQSK